MAHMVLQPVYYHPGGYYPVVPHQAMLPGPPPPAAAAGGGHGEAPYYQQQQQQQMVPMMVPGPMQPQAMQQVVPYSPMLPADTASLMGAAHSSLASWDLDHEANDDAYSTTSSIAASSTAGGLPWAPSSAASTSSSPYVSRHPHPHHQQPRYGRPLVHADDVVTVSALSSVKDAAGAVAKVLQRSAGGLLLALHRRPSDAPAAASLLAVKTLAVARFYINSRMAAMGTAGVSAAAALLGLNPAMQQQEGGAAVAAPSQQQQEGQDREEVVFIPFSRPISHQQVGAPLLPAADGQRARYQQHQQQQQQHQQGQGGFGFLLGKVGSSRVPVALPAPVGMPACMQQQATGEASSSAAPAATTPASSSGAAGAPLLLKAGGRTDANKLCAALVHHLVSQGRVAVQLAGAPACQVVLSALVAARQRLLRRFRCGLVAVASFATEDTSSELGRSTVFLRLDVMRCEAEGELLGPGAREYLPLAMA
jgi:stage V sporulation protein SpoVS